MLRFESVTVRGFRCIAHAEIEPARCFNVISGENGQGKTSLLEAFYLVVTSKSFRTDRTPDVVAQSADATNVVAHIEEGGLRREQRAVVGAKMRLYTVDGKRAARLGAYATRTPAVVFHPGDLALSSGAASLRRTLLDRIALFIDPSSADHRARYSKALRERQRALLERGPHTAEIDAYEEIAARHGSALERARAEAASRLCEALGPAFRKTAAPELGLGARFAPGGSEDESELRAALAEARLADAHRGSASTGPHKDDLDLSIDGRSARHHASQGQQRLLSLALKIAELDCVRSARGVDPILLLDDVSSELDAQRFAAVYAVLCSVPSQVFVTTARPELFQMPGLEPSDRAHFVVDRGRIARR